jgi:hypothetical protein
MIRQLFAFYFYFSLSAVNTPVVIVLFWYIPIPFRALAWFFVALYLPFPLFLFTV